MPHGHQQGWAPVEIGLFVDSHLRKGKPLPNLDRNPKIKIENDKTFAQLSFDSNPRVAKVRLHFTVDVDKVWQKRTWQDRDATSWAVADLTDFYRAELPKERPLVWFMTATDDRGATVSTEHHELN